MPISSPTYLSVLLRNVRCESVVKSELAAANTGHMQNTPASVGGWYGWPGIGDCTMRVAPNTYGTLAMISPIHVRHSRAASSYSGVARQSASGPCSHAWQRSEQ